MSVFWKQNEAIFGTQSYILSIFNSRTPHRQNISSEPIIFKVIIKTSQILTKVAINCCV